MIGHISGKLLEKNLNNALVEAGGLGYLVRLSTESLKTLPAPGGTVSLWTYLAVRQDALELFGFADREEREFFELLITLPGVGPKSALAILSQAPPAVIRKAALANDAEYLTKVAGLGRKTAEKVVLGLKDKVLDLGDLNNPAGGLSEDAAALEALQALGYGLAQAREALKKIPAGTLADAGSRIKEALKLLGRQ